MMKSLLAASTALFVFTAPALSEEALPCKLSHVIKNDETLLVSFTAPQKLDIGEGAFFWVSPKALLAGQGKTEQNPAPAIPLYVTNTVTAQQPDGSTCTLKAANTQQGFGLEVKVVTKDGAATESFVQQEPSGIIRSTEIRPYFISDYAYPRIAYDQPKLRAYFDKEIAQGREDALKQDAELRAMATEPGAETPSPNSSSTEWKVAGETQTLLSLWGEGYAYMGGAHGEGGYSALLWDKSKDAQIESAAILFTDGLASLRKTYCEALETEKKRVRGIDDPDPVGENCPQYKELTLVLTAAAGEKFSALQIIANPYVTGSYAEGAYTVTLPLTPTQLDQVKPEFRNQFVEK